jgi:hypothetical protein
MEHGIVTTVNYDNGVVSCDVRPIRLHKEYEKLPILKPHSSFIQVPKQGEVVTMQSLDDGTRFISNIIAREDGPPDSMKEGEFAIHFDDDTRIYFKKRNDGKYNLQLEASGDVNISAEGDVNIEGIDFDDHTHQYTDNTTDGSTTRTTDPPE